MNIEKSYHIGFGSDHGARYALLPGDPGRVESIARHLDNPRFYCQNREYTTWLGELDGERVLVMSTGMGGPSTAIGVEELYRTGADTYIRIGTCGGMQLDVVGGDIVIATGAIRMEGTSKEYAPVEYPAIADITVTASIISAAEKSGCNYHAGVVQSKDSFYGQHSPERMPIGYDLTNKWNAWINAGCLASEMECAALFIVSSVLRARAGAVFTCVWNQERVKNNMSNPECHDSENAIRCAVEALRLQIKKDRL